MGEYQVYIVEIPEQKGSKVYLLVSQMEKGWKCLKMVVLCRQAIITVNLLST